MTSQGERDAEFDRLARLRQAAGREEINRMVYQYDRDDVVTDAAGQAHQQLRAKLDAAALIAYLRNALDDLNRRYDELRMIVPPHMVAQIPTKP